ncbi:TonB-dependent receptor [Hyphococcus luteus]|nr:TonB-dependent receptor [Marinicaulis flavus]
MRDKTSVRKGTMTASAAALLWALLSTGTALADEPVDFDLDPAPLGDSLRAFGQQSGVAIMFSETAVAPLTAPSLKGTYEPEAALAVLLQGSGLEFVSGPDQNIIVRPSTMGNAGQAAAELSDTRTPEEGRASPVEETPVRVDEVGGDEEKEAALRQEKVTITGSLIQGIAPESSPLDIYTRADILESGAATTEQFMRSLPQNFGGGSSEFVSVGLPNDANSGSNDTLGTGANLRGLGSGSTLVLLNGSRLAPTSAIGDFVDISLIPVSALERIDILTDGASSIYGGDAVAGVVNFVLRDDFDGAETTARYGSVTDGGLNEYRLSQTVGGSWTGGNVLAVAEVLDRTNLTLADRPEISSPELSNGSQLQDLDLFQLLPAQNRFSGLVSAKQQVSASLSTSGYVLYSRRSVDSKSTTTQFPIVTQSSDANTKSLVAHGGADYDLSNVWSVSLDATYSKLDNKTLASGSNRPVSSVLKVEASTSSLDAVLRGDLFSLPGGAVKTAFGGHLRNEEFSSETSLNGRTAEGSRDVSALYAEMLIPVVGAGNELPGINRLEVNLSARFDDYSDFGSTSNPKVGLLWSPASGLKVRGTYSTSFVPPPLGRVGSLTSAGDVYPTSFVLGALGLTGQYPALEDGAYFLTFGTADDLKPQTSEAFTAGVEYSQRRSDKSISVSLNYYDLRFDDRLGRVPIPLNQDPAFAPFIESDSPGSFPDGTILFFPTLDQINQYAVQYNPNLNFGAQLDEVAIINNASITRNLSSIDTSGFDFHIDGDWNTALGNVSASLNANYIAEFVQQAAPSTPEVATLNTLYNPVDLKIRSKFGLSRDAFSGAVIINYTDSYESDESTNAVSINSWTTVDCTLSYGFDRERSDWLGGVRISLSVSNLFDEPPPVTPTLGAYRIAGYDPTNASPIGRFAMVEIAKRF